MHQADGLDGAVLLKLPSQLLLGGIKADAPHKQRLEGIPLKRIKPSLRAGICIVPYEWSWEGCRSVAITQLAGLESLGISL